MLGVFLDRRAYCGYGDYPRPQKEGYTLLITNFPRPALPFSPRMPAEFGTAEQ